MTGTWLALHTDDRQGKQHSFWYCISPPSSGDVRLEVRVARTSPPSPGEECFEFGFLPVDTTRWRIDVVNRHGQVWAHQKGIIRAVLTLVASQWDTTIVSSRSRGGNAAEFRTVDAQRMWEGLRAAGLAEYDPPDDRWRFTPGTAVSTPDHL